jgi:hypothetical protein
MDIKLTEQNWRLAARIVLHELRQIYTAAQGEYQYNMLENPHYPLSSKQAVDEIQIDMYKTAINTLEALLL